MYLRTFFVFCTKMHFRKYFVIFSLDRVVSKRYNAHSEAMNLQEKQKDMYQSSRVFYIIESALEYFISIIITGAYLAKLTSELGFSDSLTGILGAFVALGCSFQLFTIAFFKGGPVKRRVTIIHIINQLLFMSIYLVPFLGIGGGGKTALFILFLIGGYFFSNLISAPKVNWCMSLVDDGKRGVFTSVKEMVSLIGGFLFNLSMGAVIDELEAGGNTRMGFIVCAITIFVLMMLHTVTLLLTKEKETPHVASNIGVTERFRMVISDKSIVKVISVSVFWTVANHIATSFYGTYQVKELGFSMKYVAFLSIVYAAVRVPCSFFLGHYADKHSFAKMLKICYGIAALSFFVCTFAAPATGKIFFTAYYMLNAAAMGGINSAETNLIFDYVPPEKRSDTLAVKQTVYGVAGFLATVIATPLLNYIQASGNRLFGIPVYAQQVLSLLAGVATVALIIYLDKVVLKIKTVAETQEQKS